MVEFCRTGKTIEETGKTIEEKDQPLRIEALG